MKLKKLYSFLTLLTAFLWLGSGTMWSAELTVGTGSNTTDYSPFYGNYVDKNQRNQIVYAVSDLSTMSAMSGKNITSIKFYQSNANAWSGGFTISMAEISGTGFDSNTWFTDDLTKVFEGTVTGGSTVTITFDSPYYYEGGNLLIDIQTKTTSSNYQKGTFKGNTNITTKKPAAYAYNSSVSAPYATIWNLPQTTFTYEDAAPVSCPKPTDLTKGAVTATSASFTWTAGGSETSWQYVCLPAATAVDWSDAGVQTATSETATATGLTENTDYKFYVRADCGGDDYSADVIKEFHTPCVGYATASLPYTENFEGVTTGTGVYNIPSCWNRIAYVSATYGTLPYVSATEGHDAAKCLYFRKDATTTTTATIVLPPFEAATNTLTLSFWYKHNYVSSSYGKFTIGYMTDPEDVSTFVGLSGALSQATTYTHVDEFALTGAPASSYIALQYTGGNSAFGTGYIDDIVVAQASSCTKPTGLTASAAGATSINLAWTKGSDETKWNVQYRIGSGDWTLVENITTAVDGSNCTATLTGLTAQTTYEIQVQADCSGSTSNWSNSATETTDCLAKSIPWTCGFEESEGYTKGSYSSAAPECWKMIGFNNSNYPYAYVNDNSTYVKTGSQSLYIIGSTSNDAYLIFPNLDAALNTLQIAFQHKSENASKSAILTLGYMTDVKDASTFVDIKTFTRSTSWSAEEESLADVPSEVVSTARLAFKVGKATNDYYTGIDDIVISELPSCPKPKGLEVSTLKYNGATITWNAGGSETSWDLHYTDNKDLGWGVATENPLTSTTYTFSNLTPGTTYYVTVEADCGALSDEISFTPQCVTPSGLAVNSKTSTTATIGWTVNSGEAEWNVQYKKNSDADWTTVAGVTANPYTITGLTPGKNYQVKVAATCNGTYTSAVSFETECGESPIAPLGYTEGFEDFATGSTASTGLLCWAELNASHTSYSYPQMYVSTNSTYVHSGSKTLYFVSSDSKYIYAILPAFSGSYNGLQLTFWHKEEDASQSGHITLGYMTDPADASTFTAITQSAYTRATSWNEETEVLSSVPTGARLAFRYGGASNQYYAGIDDIAIETAPNCVKPSAVTASSITNEGANISWTNGGEETSWKLQYSTDNTNWTAANGGEAFTTKPFALSGLDENTTYYVQVKAVCGGSDGESTWSLAGNFTTDCDPVNMPYSQAFASSNPDCWRFSKTGGYDWSPSSTYKVSASYSMYYYGYTATENYSDMTTPSITLTEDADLKFQLRNYYYGSETTGEVYIVTSSATTKLLDFPVTTSANPWQLQTIDLSDYTGQTVKFIFRGHGKNSGAGFYIDDVEVAAKPCDAPTGLSKVETSSSVALSWTDEAASKWNLRWREVTEPESAWNDVENLTAKNLSLSTTDGLVFGKNYQAQVQAVCTDVKSSDWSSLISFGLVCGAAPANLTVSNRTATGATLTWEGTEGAFQLETSLDGDTWDSPVDVNTKTYNMTGLSAGQTYFVRVQNACGGSYATTSFKTWCGLQDAADLPLNATSFTALPECWEATFKGEWSGISGNKICFYGTEEQWIVLPAYDIDLNKLSATFTFSTSNASLEFGYIDEPNGAFTAFASQPTSGVELDLAAEAAAPKYIAVRYYDGGSNLANATISSVYVRKTPNCLAPTGVAGTPGVGSASISWTESGSAEAWNLQYKTGSADWTTVAVTENPYNLTGLEQGVSYKVRVQASCGGEDGVSDWSDEASFTTNCASIDALPFIETFDAALSNCWDITDENTSTYAHSVYGSELRLPGGKEASGHLVKLPNITASFTNAVMTIEYKATTGSGTAVPQVGYIDDLDAFQEIATLDKSNTTTEARIALASYTGKRLALRYDDGTSEGNFDIAEIRILEQVSFAEDDEDNDTKIAAYIGKTVDVTIGRTFVCADYFNTICLPFSLSAEQLAASPIASNDLWAFKYARVEGGELLIRIVEAESINAGEPYLISWPAGDAIENPLFKNVTISASAGKTMGNENLKFVGTLKPETFAAHDDSKLFLYQNNTLYWWDGDAPSNLKSFRAFFTVEGGADEMPIKHLPARIIRGEQVATGIDDVHGDVQSLKLLENGRVVIIRNGVKYSVQGQVIEK